jgi:hypothetical protein
MYYSVSGELVRTIFLVPAREYILGFACVAHLYCNAKISK